MVERFSKLKPMSMLPQPPPDAPAPPPSVAAIRSQAKQKWLWAIGLISVMVCLLGLFAPMVIRCPKKAPQTEAVSNARQIGLALFEFEQEYGCFPGFGTAKQVRANTLSDLQMDHSKSSNDFFRQLIAANVVESEHMFFARVAGTRKPDNVVTGSKALEKGECGFSYLLGATEGCDPHRPLAVTPMIPGTDRFDPKPFEGKAVVLRADNSVTSLAIDKQGHVIFEGRNLMDPKHPVWQGKPPSIAWPE